MGTNRAMRHLGAPHGTRDTRRHFIPTENSRPVLPAVMRHCAESSAQAAHIRVTWQTGATGVVEATVLVRLLQAPTQTTPKARKP